LKGSLELSKKGKSLYRGIEKYIFETSKDVAQETENFSDVKEKREGRKRGKREVLVSEGAIRRKNDLFRGGRDAGTGEERLSSAVLEK